MWEGRSKDRREKSKYTEWECGDSIWGNLLIWFHSHILQLSESALWSLSACWVFPCTRSLALLHAVPCCPACTQHLPPARACSYLQVLSPTSSPALVHGDTWGNCDSAPSCHCIILFSLRLETGLGKHISFPSWLVPGGERKLFFSP